MSVIENPKPHGMSYNRWQGDIEKLSNRDRLCFDIDEVLAKKPHDFAGFLSLMEQAGYTITQGKNITFSHPRQKRNIRMRSLPEEYQKDAIIAVLSGKKIHNPHKRRSPMAVQKAQLVSNLEAKQNQGRGHYYDLSIQNQITKQQAKALLYYQQHGFSTIDDFGAFSASVADCKKRRDELSTKITSAEKRMNEIAVLQKHITNYLKTKDVYAGYAFIAIINVQMGAAPVHILRPKFAAVVVDGAFTDLGTDRSLHKISLPFSLRPQPGFCYSCQE